MQMQMQMLIIMQTKYFFQCDQGKISSERQAALHKTNYRFEQCERSEFL